MKNIISISQLIISVIIIVLVLLQERGSGMGESFGGSEGGGFSQQRRGLEKTIFYATIIALVIFGGVSLANLLL